MNKIIKIQNTFAKVFMTASFSVGFFVVLSLTSPSSYGENMMTQKCGNKPNCVSSFDDRKEFFFPPIEKVEGPWDQVKAKIEKTITSFASAKVESTKENYLHIIVTTKLMRFKDDLYFWWDPETEKLSMKSESRVGYSDLGANKKRLKTFIQEWTKN